MWDIQYLMGVHTPLFKQNFPPLRNISSTGEIVVHFDQLCIDNVPHFINAAG